MIAPPEWSVPLRVEAIGGGLTRTIEADERALAALAERFGVEAIARAAATLHVAPIAGGVAVRGVVEGDVRQRCAVTDASVETAVREPVALQYLRDWVGDGPSEEIELDADACDRLPLEDEIVDLGEAAAQTLALAIPAFPRAPDADAVAAARGWTGQAKASPFAALAALRGGDAVD